MSDPRVVLVMAPNWLGDAVMALPAIADVRRRFAAAQIVVAARGAVVPLFGMVPGVDTTIRLEWNGRWSTRREMARDVERLAAAGADIAILLPNSFASAWLVRRAGVPARWGYAADLRSPLLTRAVARPRGSVHQAAYYQHLTRALGIGSGPLEPAIAVPEAAAASVERRLRERGWDGSAPLVAFAPGAAYGAAKRWEPSYVARLATRLVTAHGACAVLVGSRADAETTGDVRAAIPRDAARRVVDLAGQTSLEELAAVLARARVCVTNDSGAMHVAAAVGTPVVAIFGPTREAETAPLTRSTGRAEVVTHAVWCRPCMLRECPLEHQCMTGITPERVEAVALRLMASDPGVRT